MDCEKKRVAIVGAGASGLCSIRHALLYGLEPVCFEHSDNLGGLWRYKSDVNEEGSVMKSTVINTSKEMTAFSDFPPPDHFPNFMPHRTMLEYFTMYADHFDLRKYIHLQHTVTNVERGPTFDKDGCWIVHYVDHNNCTRSETFDCVLICIGHHTRPYYPPKWPGQDQFCGRIRHAHEYKSHNDIEDKVAVVVGIGNSGVDVAVELSHVASQVYLSTRRGAWIFSRLREFGIPYDLILFTRFSKLCRQLLPLWLINAVLQALVQLRFKHEHYGIKPVHSFFSAHPTVNDELPIRLSSGQVIIKSNISRFEEHGIVFDDESQVEHVDEVVLCTGYSFAFSIIEGGKLIPVHENKVSLYQRMYPVELCEHNTLAAIGYIQPLGSIMPISEMQARLFFDVFVGHTRLPDRHVMETEIQTRHDKLIARYVNSRRHTIQVDYDFYMDELADHLNCRPQPLKYLFSDPMLSLYLLFAGNMPYGYRLRGPHAWPGARDAILNSSKRVRSGPSHRPVVSTDSFSLLSILLLCTAVAVVIALFAQLVF